MLNISIKNILLGVALMIAMPTASAITIDGSPDDWGPAGFLTADWKLNDTWLPNDGINFIVEDNRNPKYPVPGSDPYTGVHIKGTGSTYSFYDEPPVTLNDGRTGFEPYGYERYDLEGYYFKQDDSNVYFLIVTSPPPDAAGEEAPGDLRINVGPGKSGDGWPYEMGVKLGTKTGLTQFDLYKVDKWGGSNYIPANRPSIILEGTDLGRVEGKYEPCPTCNLGTGKDGMVGKELPIYIVELKIPKSMLDGIRTYSSSEFSLTDTCTNDKITIVPEFAVVALPLAAVIGLVYVLRMRRKEQ